jgi:hypothetical protein
MFNNQPAFFVNGAGLALTKTEGFDVKKLGNYCFVFSCNFFPISRPGVHEISISLLYFILPAITGSHSINFPISAYCSFISARVLRLSRKLSVWFQRWEMYIRLLTYYMTNIRKDGRITFHLFVNFKVSNDSIGKTQLFKAMDKFQIPRKLEITLQNTRNKVKTLSGITDPLDTKKGHMTCRSSDLYV